MSSWLLDEGDLEPVKTAASRGNDLALRLLDVGFGTLLLTLLSLPLLLALAIGRLRRQTVRGRDGQPFERLILDLPESRTGRVLAAFGAGRWPVLINILRGQMAFVGPRARSVEEPAHESLNAVRPGLANPWFIRRRTAVDFGSEPLADAEYLARRSFKNDVGLLVRGLIVAMLPPPAPPAHGRVHVGDVAFDNVSMDEAVARLSEMLDGQTSHQVSFVNPFCVNVAASHRGYRRVLARTALVLPDGIGIKIGSDIVGKPLKQNVNGTDLFPRLCDLLVARNAGLFLLGGQPGVPERVAATIALRWPTLRIVGMRDGFFPLADEGLVAEQVRASGADAMLVARGVPMQDLFIDRYLPLFGVKIAMGVGGLFDFASGRIQRAPMWMRESGLEWVYRLLQEPGRMWQRYLVGNLTFLSRVGLQRLGLRSPADDTQEAASPSVVARSSLRVALFATRLAGEEMPVPADYPAALLPLGHASILERVMEQLALASVTDVDIVVCDRPELLRERIGDGRRWGIHLTWHLARDPLRPYAVLQTAALKDAGRVVIGRADRCLDAAAVKRLIESPQRALQSVAEGQPADAAAWSGWASVSPGQLAGLPADGDEAALAQALQAGSVPGSALTAGECSVVDSAEALLAAQFHPADGAEGADELPGSWVRRVWGAMSPQALVEDGATIVGPVLIGAGCIVERGASVGPNVVLSRDVVVSAGTAVRDSIVLPRSYLGQGLELKDAIVNGPRVRHVSLGFESALATSDAVLLSLESATGRRASWLGRALAGLALLGCSPVLLAHLLSCRIAGQPRAWTMRSVVGGRDPVQHQVRMVSLRCPRAGARRKERVLTALAALTDVATGRRCWFGARPRTYGEWNALSPEWQSILGNAPVGLVHAPAWTDDPSNLMEARAAADVFHAVNPSLRSNWEAALATMNAWRKRGARKRF
jgi:N-acetylglucosaminyldiphosphoundecaprenol N-acetyl-beta-D-mannosaminyltransferase